MKVSYFRWSRLDLFSHREKIAELCLDFRPSKLTQAPILDACPVVLDCKVDRIIEEDGTCHIFAKILDRLADSDLLDGRGPFKNDRFAPTYFMGDGHKRVYRYLVWGQCPKSTSRREAWFHS